MNNEPITWEEMQEFAKQLADKVNGNTPIAWYNADESSLSFKNHGGGWQPLYTHPVNPKYDPETGEPLIDGYPLFSGLPHPV